MSRSRMLIGMLSIGLTSLVSAASDSTSDAGFTPLAAVTVNITAEQIPALRDMLKKFAASENLTFLEGEISRQGRTVEQFYLKQGAEPAILVHNFMDPLGFESIAYSHGTEDAWKPRWKRFVAAIRNTFGPRSIAGE